MDVCEFNERGQGSVLTDRKKEGMNRWDGTYVYLLEIKGEKSAPQRRKA
jgi:hypothetical protein